MSAPHISASKVGASWRLAWPLARSAGWSRAELWWEQLQELGNEALEAGNRRSAVRMFRLAHWICRAALSRSDARWATSVANLAVADRLTGAHARSLLRFAEARRLWADVPLQVETADIAPKARSSLFHLRMEALHRQTFDANRRKRLAAFVHETAETLDSLANNVSPQRRHFARWRGEKPAIYDGGRRILAACLLVAVPLREERET